MKTPKRWRTSRDPCCKVPSPQSPIAVMDRHTWLVFHSVNKHTNIRADRQSDATKRIISLASQSKIRGRDNFFNKNDPVRLRDTWKIKHLGWWKVVEILAKSHKVEYLEVSYRSKQSESQVCCPFKLSSSTSFLFFMNTHWSYIFIQSDTTMESISFLWLTLLSAGI